MFEQPNAIVPFFIHDKETGKKKLSKKYFLFIIAKYCRFIGENSNITYIVVLVAFVLGFVVEVPLLLLYRLLMLCLVLSIDN